MAGMTRLELATFCVTGKRSNQTELHSHGSDSWIRTSDTWINSPMPYHLAMSDYYGGMGTRTPNPLNANQVLYQLSHTPIKWLQMVESNNPGPSYEHGKFTRTLICCNIILVFFLWV